MDELTEVMQRSKSNTKRLDKLEEENAVLHKMATSLEVLSNEMKHMRESQENLSERIARIEEMPAKRYETLISAVLGAMVCLAVGYLFGGGI